MFIDKIKYIQGVIQCTYLKETYYDYGPMYLSYMVTELFPSFLNFSNFGNLAVLEYDATNAELRNNALPRKIKEYHRIRDL